MYKPSPYFPEKAFTPSLAVIAWLDLWCERMPHERMPIADLMASHTKMKAERARQAARWAARSAAK